MSTEESRAFLVHLLKALESCPPEISNDLINLTKQVIKESL